MPPTTDSPPTFASALHVAATLGDELQFNSPEARPLPPNPVPRRNTLISSFRTSHSAHVHVLPGSVKFAIQGEIDVETRRGRYRLNNRRFVIVNAWEPYTFQIASRSAAQTCSLFFRTYYLASLHAAATTSDARQLERLSDTGLPMHLEFPEALFHARSNGVGDRLRALVGAWEVGVSAHCLSDRVRDVGEALVALRSTSLAQVNGIRAAKRSTREELYRRVQRATVFVRDNFAGEIDLVRVAQQAGMAPHHLHRTFRAINGYTLHQWIVQLRMDEARRLVQHTDVPISVICRRVGYSSLPSFTTLFRTRFGRPPVALRRADASE